MGFPSRSLHHAVAAGASCRLSSQSAYSLVALFLGRHVNGIFDATYNGYPAAEISCGHLYDRGNCTVPYNLI
jgi:hypothetical protein